MNIYSVYVNIQFLSSVSEVKDSGIRVGCALGMTKPLSRTFSTSFAGFLQARLQASHQPEWLFSFPCNVENYSFSNPGIENPLVMSKTLPVEFSLVVPKIHSVSQKNFMHSPFRAAQIIINGQNTHHPREIMHLFKKGQVLNVDSYFLNRNRSDNNYGFLWSVNGSSPCSQVLTPNMTLNYTI